MKKQLRAIMKFFGLTKLIAFSDSYVNQKIFANLEKISEGDEIEKIRILSEIINPELFNGFSIGLSAQQINIVVYKTNLEEQIKDLKRLTFHLKNRRKVSSTLLSSDLKTIFAHEYFRTSDNCFIDIGESIKTLLVLTADFCTIASDLKRSKNAVDLENYFAIRTYISNIVSNLESLAKVIIRN